METPQRTSPHASPPLAHFVLGRLCEAGAPLPVASHEEPELRGSKQLAHLRSLAGPTLTAVFLQRPHSSRDSTLSQTGLGRGRGIPQTQTRKKQTPAEETTRAEA